MSRGRGQPPKIGADRYPELLSLLTDGLSVAAVARRMNVSRATLYNLADRVPEVGEAMDRARATARARHVPSESCYVNNGCRSRQCTEAATEARARRRAAEAAPVTDLPTPARPSVYELLADDVPPLADSA